LSRKSFEVSLTPAADRDLDDIYRNVAERGSFDEADALIGSLIDRAQAVSTFPERGVVPQELDAVGKRQYRQVFVPPYRIIYRRIGDMVFVYLIADGRRDMRTLLHHRQLSS